MKTLGFIGMGNMAGAIAAGILQKGLMKKEEVFAYAPHYEKLEANAEKIGFVPCKDLKGLTAKADTLVMACKPYQIEGVLSEIKEELKGKALIDHFLPNLMFLLYKLLTHLLGRQLSHRYISVHRSDLQHLQRKRLNLLNWILHSDILHLRFSP